MARHFTGLNILKDTGVTLGAGAGQDPDVDFQMDLADDRNSGLQSLLTYMINPGSSGVSFKIFILNPGETEVVNSTISIDVGGYARQEVINPDILANAVGVRIRVTRGSATFSDVALLYSRRL